MAGSRVILYTGKGGTGKSVVACATGLKAAELRYNTLVLSADPAHTLSDAFETRVEDEPTRVSRNLWAIQVDSVREMRKNFAAVQEYAASVFAARGIDEATAYELASLPTMTHLFTLLKMEELMASGRFDILILDTVPSGEALRYLYFPRLIGSVSRKLIKLVGPVAGLAKALEPIIGIPTPSRKVLDAHVTLIERFEKLADILRNGNICSLRLLANPDSFSIENAKRTLMVSSLYGINVDLVIINKIFPEEVRDPYFKNWMRIQSKLLAESEAMFYPIPVKKLRLFESEPRGRSMLKRCGEMLFGEDDPSRIFYRGSPFSIRHEGDGLTLSVKVPYAEKDSIDVERIGGELIVKVRTDVGEAVNVIPLPSAALTMRLAQAKLLKGELRIDFVREHE